MHAYTGWYTWWIKLHNLFHHFGPTRNYKQKIVALNLFHIQEILKQNTQIYSTIPKLSGNDHNIHADHGLRPDISLLPYRTYLHNMMGLRHPPKGSYAEVTWQAQDA